MAYINDNRLCICSTRYHIASNLHHESSNEVIMTENMIKFWTRKKVVRRKDMNAIETIGDAVKQIRESKGMERMEVADKGIMSVFTLRNIELGVQYPTLKTLSRIANGLDVKISDIVIKMERLNNG